MATTTGGNRMGPSYIGLNIVLMKKSQTKNHFYINTHKCLVKQIVVNIPRLCIEELENPTLMFGNLDSVQIIEDIHTYGEVVSKDIDKNTERINKNQIPYIPVKTIYRQLRKANKFSNVVGEEI